MAPIHPVGTHIMAHATYNLVNHTVVQSAVGAILGLHHLISTLHCCHCVSCHFGWLENALQKSRSRQCGSYLASIDTLGIDIAIDLEVNCENKIEFSLVQTDYVSFVQTVTYTYLSYLV